MTYRVVLTTKAKQLLAEVKDRREQKLLIARLKRLSENPEQQGKSLKADLTECRSIRAVGQRYRIIYRVEKEAVLVIVVALGRRKEGDRKDVYQLAQKLVQTLQLEQLSSDDTEEQSP